MSFHVPNKYRVRFGHFASDDRVGNNGAFFVPSRDRSAPPLKIIASDGEGWEHVSVSLPHRCPTWSEMSQIKALFWDLHDCVVQYHPPASEYVNNHAFCLHLWRPTAHDIPMPPAWMVGIKGMSPTETAQALADGRIAPLMSNEEAQALNREREH